MSQSFITLTAINPDSDEGEIVHLNHQWIRSIERPDESTRIDLMGGSRGSVMRGAELWVRESPEQIMELMEGTERL